MGDPIESAGTGPESALERSAIRRPYFKPFVRNLDVMGTEGGKFVGTAEGIGHESTGGSFGIGPS